MSMKKCKNCGQTENAHLNYQFLQERRAVYNDPIQPIIIGELPCDNFEEKK